MLSQNMAYDYSLITNNLTVYPEWQHITCTNRIAHKHTPTFPEVLQIGNSSNLDRVVRTADFITSQTNDANRQKIIIRG